VRGELQFTQDEPISGARQVGGEMTRVGYLPALQELLDPTA